MAKKLSRKRLFLIIGIISVLIGSVLLLPTAAFAWGRITFTRGGITCGEEEEVDYVDIGDPGSESGHRLRGWGPIEPATSGGNYGGIDDCRVTWEPGSADRLWRRGALFRMTLPSGYKATKLVLNVLDGIADDSFVVFVGLRKVYCYSNGDPINDPEEWHEHTIDLDRCSSLGRRITVTILATGPAWNGFGTYGQLAVDEATLFGKKCSFTHDGCHDN